MLKDTTKTIFNPLNIGISRVTNRWLPFSLPDDESRLMVSIKACK